MVLTDSDINKTCDFYSTGTGHGAITFGSPKINLHEQDKEFTPAATSQATDSADLCFITKHHIDEK